MNEPVKIVHDTVRVERVLKALPEKVFSAWTDHETRKRWEPTPEGMEMDYNGHDFRVGGYEKSRMRQGENVVAEFDTYFLDIALNKRIVSSVRVVAQGVAMSCSQNTVDLRPHAAGTLIICHEQVAWFHGNNMRREHEGGWSTLLERLAAEVE